MTDTATDRARLAEIRDRNRVFMLPHATETDLLRMAEDGIAWRERAEKAEAALARVTALHQPWRIYDECDCTDEQRDATEHHEIDEVGFTCNMIAVVCSECCIERDYHSEECATYHDHGDGKPLCATRRAITGEA
ncbi:MAG: hypothetical protein AB7U23_12625 [Dehalococcoidia bacterium]